MIDLTKEPVAVLTDYDLDYRLLSVLEVNRITTMHALLYSTTVDLLTLRNVSFDSVLAIRNAARDYVWHGRAKGVIPRVRGRA